MQQVANAYARVQQSTQSPRELESSILLKAGQKLQAVKDGWPESERDLDGASPTTASSGPSSSRR